MTKRAWMAAAMAMMFSISDPDAAKAFIASRSIQGPFRTVQAVDATKYLNPVAAVRMANLMAAAEAATGERALVTEQWRSDATQAVYYANIHGPTKFNGQVYQPERYVGAGPVARPGNSNHRLGLAIDVSNKSPLARSWMRKNAADFGLYPLPGDEPHIQLNKNAPLTADEQAYAVKALGFGSVEDFQKSAG